MQASLRVFDSSVQMRESERVITHRLRRQEKYNFTYTWGTVATATTCICATHALSGHTDISLTVCFLPLRTYRQPRHIGDTSEAQYQSRIS